ncbi:MAG: hypothetical protein GEU74_08635 [Nitriliruptorales bacterium]|nr:hypothetical protein [Nitriliruptorales bacterium]
MVDGRAPGELLLGTWARTGAFVGLVVAVDGESVSLFDPAERQVASAARADVQAVPAGGVNVTVAVDLPVPHGIDESALRRWVAALTDDTLRERAHAALIEQGLDEGAALPAARVSVAPVPNGTVCLCGSRMPAPAGAEMVCSSCGRLAVGPPASH